MGDGGGCVRDVVYQIGIEFSGWPDFNSILETMPGESEAAVETADTGGRPKNYRQLSA